MNGGTRLLEQAISYAARTALDVTPALLPHPTPCRNWNLDMLLRHVSESLAVLYIHRERWRGRLGRSRRAL